MNIEAIYKVFLASSGVATDTRNLLPGNMYFALKGGNFNGNDFVKHALDNGASSCVADEERDFKDDRIILVENCLDTLQHLAAYHRKQFTIPVIAITGSNGKTTTKELMHQVLSTTFRTYTTVGNLNNHIGIPLTLLKIKDDAQVAIVEMGANHAGEIASYCTYTNPTHGLITNCGKAHLEGFGSIEGVRKAKTELFSYLEKHNGTVFLNADYDYLQPYVKNIKEKITYGTGDATYSGSEENGSDLLVVHARISNGREFSVSSQLVGGYNLPNILAAIAVGSHFGVKDDDIKNSLESYTPTNSRSQSLKKNGNDIILDAYNANPSSMEAAIRNFAATQGDRKILILGSMRELGKDADIEHEQILKLIGNYKWEAVVLCGEGYKNIPEGMLSFKNAVEAGEWLKHKEYSGAKILIKGSRGMQMEKVLE